jgi:hypothetical protein
MVAGSCLRQPSIRRRWYALLDRAEFVFDRVAVGPGSPGQPSAGLVWMRSTLRTSAVIAPSWAAGFPSIGYARLLDQIKDDILSKRSGSSAALTVSGVGFGPSSL